jgi:hypothetical protein
MKRTTQIERAHHELLEAAHGYGRSMRLKRGWGTWGPRMRQAAYTWAVLCDAKAAKRRAKRKVAA